MYDLSEFSFLFIFCFVFDSVSGLKSRPFCIALDMDKLGQEQLRL